MKLFRITHPGFTIWRGTLSLAKAYVRKDMPKADRCKCLVEELDVQTDKTGIVAAFNNAPITKLLCSYEVSARGALVEPAP